jgi:hypothetical protein
MTYVMELEPIEIIKSGCPFPLRIDRIIVGSVADAKGKPITTNLVKIGRHTSLWNENRFASFGKDKDNLYLTLDTSSLEMRMVKEFGTYNHPHVFCYAGPVLPLPGNMAYSVWDAPFKGDSPLDVESIRHTDGEDAEGRVGSSVVRFKHSRKEFPSMGESNG